MKKIKFHILFWSLYFVYICLLDILLGEFSGLTLQFFFFLTHHLVIFYSAYFVHRKLSFSTWQKTLVSLLYLVASFVLFFIFRYFFMEYIMSWIYPGFKALTDFRLFFLDGIVWYIQYTFYATGFYFVERSIQKERSLRISEEKQLKIESAFLRSQINPHFLQNTLNYFYSRALTGNTRELSEGILLLSDIMRYSLESQGDSSNRVLVSRETEHLRNFVSINQLRFSNNLKIDLDISGDISSVKIVPLVMITLVENAFKHGDMNDALHPLVITLSVDKGEKPCLQFSVSNKKRMGPKEPSHGIGIDNTRRRLDTAYPGKYSLVISDRENDYKAELIIWLTPGADIYPTKEQDEPAGNAKDRSRPSSEILSFT